MTDPTRWCDDPGDLSPAEQRVLQADAQFGPPHHAKSTVWAGIATGLGAVGEVSAKAAGAIVAANGAQGVAAGGAAAAAGPAGLGLGLGTVVKLVLVGVGIGTSLAVAGHYASSHDEAKTVLQSHSMTASTVAPQASHQVAHSSDTQQRMPESPRKPIDGESTANEVLLPPTAADRRREPFEPDVPDNGSVGGLAPSAQLNSEAPVVVPVSPDAREESQVIGNARSALRSGDAARALQLLELAERRYPQGVLNQEREALRVEALTRLGRIAEARERAKAFLSAYPTSPYASRVKNRIGEQ